MVKWNWIKSGLTAISRYNVHKRVIRKSDKLIAQELLIIWLI